MVFNVMDMLGYVNFSDEVMVLMWLVDGVLFVVDVCEGVMILTTR